MSQQNLFDWKESIVYLASGRSLNKHSWLGDVILYTSIDDQDYLVPIQRFKTWHDNGAYTSLPVGSWKLVDVIEKGACFRIHGRVNDGVPF
jgi:hypothetical protein